MADGRRRPGGKKTNTHGLRQRNFEKAIAWRVDQDYADRLTPEDQEWLAKFNDRYYGGDFRSADEEDWPTERRREVWTTKNAARVDAHTFASSGGLLDSLDVERHEEALAEATPNGTDPVPTPEHLNSPRYKQAREAFRSLLKPGRVPKEPDAKHKGRLAWARVGLERATKKPHGK